MTILQVNNSTFVSQLRPNHSRSARPPRTGRSLLFHSGVHTTYLYHYVCSGMMGW